MRFIPPLFAILCFFASCSSRRFVPQGEYLLESVRITSTNPSLNTTELSGYIHQHPNSKWFSVLKVPMGPYLLQGSDSTCWVNRFLRKIGEKPVIYNPQFSERTTYELQAATVGKGYLHSQVKLEQTIKKHKIHINYVINPGPRTYIRSITYQFPDTVLEKIYTDNQSRSLLHTGMPFDINLLSQERSRITNLYLNNGFYKFNKSFVRYLADTVSVPGTVALTMQVLPYRESSASIAPAQHTCFTFDSVYYDAQAYRQLRKRVLQNANLLKRGNKYSEQDVVTTYSRLSRLGNVLNSTAHFTQRDSNHLNAKLLINTARKHSLQLSPEATNTAGDLGAAVGLTYQNRNIFRGGETFSFKIRTAYEAVKGLDGYSNNGYFEYSAEASLLFPSFKFPFLSRQFRIQSLGTTELSLMYASQDRPEFHRRVLTAALRYRWYKYNRRMQHRLDMLDLNYIFMPWISETFRNDYLDNATSRNAILRYNYENLFIMKLGYTYSYVSRTTVGNTNRLRNSTYSIRTSIETAGNILRAASAIANNKANDDGYLHFFGNAYAQYVKGDFDYSKSYIIDDRNSFAFHTYLGIAYPYGNSTILPYEKRYFSGGANSVRGWSVRGLGPGKFKGTDGRIDFINQTGDIKLDLSVEFRSRLFWKLYGALFIDAGNIWTIRNYVDQPGGQFRFNTFVEQIAVAYGLGFRLNFDYFVIRLDGGMKAINPAYDDKRSHYSIIHPAFSRDFTLHFAVGLPF